MAIPAISLDQNTQLKTYRRGCDPRKSEFGKVNDFGKTAISILRRPGTFLLQSKNKQLEVVILFSLVSYVSLVYFFHF